MIEFLAHTAACYCFGCGIERLGRWVHARLHSHKPYQSPVIAPAPVHDCLPAPPRLLLPARVDPPRALHYEKDRLTDQLCFGSNESGTPPPSPYPHLRIMQ